MKLAKCKVVFDELKHTYTLGDKTLSGVTGLLGRQLFQSKYDGIPEEVMNKAAERGNLIHRQIEMYEALGGDTLASSELASYIGIKESNGYKTIGSEYLVSNNETVASAIDVVYEKDGKVILCDIKTTSKLDMKYLSWQLSIYKYLFLIGNPKLKVEGLVAVWLPKEQYGEPTLVEVEEIDQALVEDLIATDARGEQWVDPTAEEPVDIGIDEETLTRIAEEERLYKRYKELHELNSAYLLEVIDSTSKATLKTDAIQVVYRAASNSSKFDSAALKKQYPDIYKEFVVEKETKASVSIKLMEN